MDKILDKEVHQLFKAPPLSTYLQSYPSSKSGMLAQWVEQLSQTLIDRTKTLAVTATLRLIMVVMFSVHSRQALPKPMLATVGQSGTNAGGTPPLIAPAAAANDVNENR